MVTRLPDRYVIDPTRVARAVRFVRDKQSGGSPKTPRELLRQAASHYDLMPAEIREVKKTLQKGYFAQRHAGGPAGSYVERRHFTGRGARKHRYRVGDVLTTRSGRPASRVYHVIPLSYYSEGSPEYRVIDARGVRDVWNEDMGLRPVSRRPKRYARDSRSRR